MTKYLCGDAQVFAFKLLLVNKLVDMSKIQNESLLSQTVGSRLKAGYKQVLQLSPSEANR